MSYRETQKLSATNKSSLAKTGAPVQPEDDWNRAGNPSMVLDELP